MEDSMNTFKWLIGIFILLFILWFFTGGPERFKKEKPGPFLKPPYQQELNIENPKQSNR